MFPFTAAAGEVGCQSGLTGLSTDTVQHEMTTKTKLIVSYNRKCLSGGVFVFVFVLKIIFIELGLKYNLKMKRGIRIKFAFVKSTSYECVKLRNFNFMRRTSSHNVSVVAHLWGKTCGFYAECKSTSICSDKHIDTYLSVFSPVQKGVQHETGKVRREFCVRRSQPLPCLTVFNLTGPLQFFISVCMSYRGNPEIDRFSTSSSSSPSFNFPLL